MTFWYGYGSEPLTRSGSDSGSSPHAQTGARTASLCTHNRPSRRIQAVLWICKYFFRIRNPELPGRPINYGSGYYLDISVVIEKKICWY
jgi:hypothetical protein